MRTQLVSVIMPVYNVCHYIQKSVESVLNQTYKNIELILIDDGSSDGSEIECDLFEKNDCRVRVVHQLNSGVSAARNKGLSIAKGELITFIDSDDIVEQNYIELMYQEMIGCDVDIVRFAWERGGKNFTYNVPFDKNGRFIVTMSNIDDFSCFANIWGLFKKESLGNIRFNEHLKYAEDHLFLLEYYLKSKMKKMLLVDKPYYHYTIVKNSATQITPIECLKPSMLFSEQLLVLCEDYPKVTKLAKQYLYDALVRAFFYLSDAGFREIDGVSIENLKMQIKVLRKDGFSEATLISRIVCFLYWHNLNCVVSFIKKYFKGSCDKN